MGKVLDYNGKLDFSEIDLTPPNKVVEEIIAQLPKVTNNYIFGKIESYYGNITSYKKSGLSSITASLGVVDREVDIQEDLGKCGDGSEKYECYLYTDANEHFKYRLFFMQYNIARYPVKLVLEKGVAGSISPNSQDYIFYCRSRAELEDFIEKILTSKRVISVMQEIIRVNQATKYVEESIEDENRPEE